MNKFSGRYARLEFACGRYDSTKPVRIVPARWTMDNRPVVWTVTDGFYNMYVVGFLKHAGLTLDEFIPLYLRESNMVPR